MEKTERYKLRQAAVDRVNELNERPDACAIYYHGHREWVVKYVVQEKNEENV